MGNNFTQIRREYGNRALSKSTVDANPLKQLTLWLNEAKQSGVLDPTAMNMATVDENNHPDLRVVLLKKIHNGQLIFFTKTNSPKCQQINAHPNVAISFYWPEISRQVRIKGTAKRVPFEIAETYFLSRPRNSQLASIASTQSEPIKNRETLEALFEKVTQEYTNKPITCPNTWGGLGITPSEFEFWQGRDQRLHDRLRYQFKNNAWAIERLMP